MIILTKVEYNQRVREIRKKLLSSIGRCQNCGFDKYITILEVSHIKHGKELSKLNEKNLLLLCPTCHKLFDRGIISINKKYSDAINAKPQKNYKLHQRALRERRDRIQPKRIDVWIKQPGGKLKLERQRVKKTNC